MLKHLTPIAIWLVHDFFTPNPVTNARVFFLRFILHDWPDATCIQILKNLRVSAAPDTELIINECLIQYACSTETIVEKIVPGARMKSPPSPLLPNLGYARVFDYLIDLQVCHRLLTFFWDTTLTENIDGYYCPWCWTYCGTIRSSTAKIGLGVERGPSDARVFL